PSHALSIAFALKERLVLMKTATTARPVARAAAIAVAFAGVAVTASYSQAEEKKPAAPEAKSVEIERVTVVGDGATSVSSADGRQIVMVRRSGGGGADVDIEEALAGVTMGDGAPRVMVLGGGDVDVAGGKIAIAGVDCKDADGKPVKPLIDEKTESADGKTKTADRLIICTKTNGETDPKKQAEALRKAVVRMQADAAREAEHRQRMIAVLQARIAELEKTAK
ncbi:MAG: hypothetical protein K2Q06_11505, partial [Parvularculaceae bacterium]|nr:hypothetical protein [Parvularculaceae bacterium]